MRERRRHKGHEEHKGNQELNDLTAKALITIIWTSLVLLRVLCVLAVIFGAALTASAQPYPSRLIRIVVPLPPGGSNDLLARIAADRLTASLGQTVVVDNRPGASGNIGTELVAKSAADGHTLLMANTAHVINPSLFVKLPYDPIRDFAAVALMSSVHFALVVHPSVPARSVKEFIAVARSRPGALTFASAGNGAPHHLAMELLKSVARVDLTHIPYKGAGQFVPALLTGEVSSVIGAINSLLPHVQAGRLRALGMAGSRRTPLLPDVPTISEAALPGFALDNWGGLLAPAGTPRNTIDRLYGEIAKALREPQTSERLAAQGIEVTLAAPDEFQALMKVHMAKWAKVVREAGIKLEL
jgi:tripartite-type tricarboxylate transporter receptor subunit TctC